MAGRIVWALVKLYCRAGCSGKAVAAALAFHPPDPPFYEVVEKTAKGLTDSDDAQYDVILRGDIEALVRPVFSRTQVTQTVHKIETKSKSVINCFFFHHPQAKATILFSHGNAADIGAMTPRFLEIATHLEVNVCGYDYSGYGGGTGSPTEHQVHYDAAATLSFLQRVYQIRRSEIIVYGESIGSGPTTKLAASKGEPFLGCVLHAPLKSGLRILTSNRILCCCDIFPNIDVIRRAKCPVWVIHGLADDQIPVIHGQDLHRNVPDEYKTDPWWVPRAGHSDIVYNNFKAYIVRFRKFLSLSLDRRERLGETNGASKSVEKGENLEEGVDIVPRPESGNPKH
jgi:abhydrolase domain-containing protein 17